MRSRRIPACVIVFVLAAGSVSSRCQNSSPAADSKGRPGSESDAGSEARAKAIAGNSSGAKAAATPASGAAGQEAAPAVASQPASLFDVLSGRFVPVVTTVEVHGAEREIETGAPEPLVAGGQEVLSTAGTWGDVSRFLQVLPGVVASNDLSNEVLVRGGHPMENLFLVDGIEVPNINHIATLGTTGGFGPMIDTGVIQSVALFAGGYDARYPERLSSVIDIKTLNSDNVAEHAEGDLGIEGFGGLAEKRFRGNDLLVSAHHGFLDVMDSVGLNGLPSYTNEFARLRRSDDAGNRLTLLHVAGWDSIEVEPCPADAAGTSTIDSQYSGWRVTTGAEWQHVFSSNGFGVANVSDSEQIEHIHQQDQLINPMDPKLVPGPCPVPASVDPPVPVYLEDSNNAFSTAGYRYEWSSRRIALMGGSGFWLERPHYQIGQPLGAYSPYSAAPVRADSTSFTSDFSIGESGTFAQLTVHPLKALALGAGGRLQTFALGAHSTLTPRLSLQYSFGESVGIHLAFAGYAQMPPYVYLLSYPQNRSILPMRSTHEVVGMDLGFWRSSHIRMDAYNKIYRDIPASTEYPTVNLHDMVDMLGQQFVWLPLNSGGRGNSSGIELSDVTQIHSSLVVRGSIAYSRAKFAGLDHVLRPSNFDLPWIVNFAMLKQLKRGYQFSSRYGYATGRPYTPYDWTDSLAQNRPIYDVTKMNALRVPYYSRLDAQVNKDAIVHGLHLELYCGVNNLLNRQNFLAYVWTPRLLHAVPKPFTELYQMPIFPNFGVRYIFR